LNPICLENKLSNKKSSEFKNIQLTMTALKRLKKDYLELQKDPIFGITAQPVEKNMFV